MAIGTDAVPTRMTRFLLALGRFLPMVRARMNLLVSLSPKKVLMVVSIVLFGALVAAQHWAPMGGRPHHASQQIEAAVAQAPKQQEPESKSGADDSRGGGCVNLQRAIYLW